jgi:hypothetical protein
MNTSNDDAERHTIQGLLSKEETRVRAEEPADGPDEQSELNRPADRES